MKSDWIKYFPFKEVRIQQEQSLNFAIKEFKAGKRFVLLECPTGVGKSGIAITLGKYFQARMQTPGVRTGTYITTPQKILQAQYENDFADINNVSAKQNYTCVQRPGNVSCQIGQWMNQIALTYSQQASYNEECPYKIAKKRFKEGILSLTNVAYMLNNVMYTDEITKRQLLIVDECHMLESALVEFVAMDFDGVVIEEELGIDWNTVTDKTDIAVFTDWVVSTYLPRVKDLVETLKRKIKTYAMKHGSNFDKAHMRLLNLSAKYDTIECQLNRYLEHFEQKDWVMSVDEMKQIVKIQPIYASKYAESHLFKVADKVLLMSGTILDKEAFCSNLGIKQSEAAFVSLDSPFPKENRPIISMNVGLMSYNNINATLPKLAAAVREILNSHAKDKGIIHTNSFKIAEYLQKSIGGSRLLLHNSKNRIQILQEHIDSKYPTVLISPSFTEGIDLFDERSRFQIIAKVPFPFLGDKYVKVKMERIPEWYAWETCKTIIQASGRSVRSVDDHAWTYILDGSFENFFRNNKKLFPQWWKDALEFI
jgi:ATP-dependent DNA helicase DinG